MYVLTKPLLFQHSHKRNSLCWPNNSHSWGCKILLNQCWSNFSHSRQKLYLTCVVRQPLLTKPIPCKREHKILLNHSMPAGTQTLSQHELTKLTPFQPGDIMHYNMFFTNLSQASEDITTCEDQTHPMLSRIINESQHVLTKSFLWKRGHRMHLNLSWPTPPMSARTKIVPQHVFTIPIPCQGGQKIHPNLWWPNAPMSARAKNVSYHVLNNPIPCQRGHDMQLKFCWQNTCYASGNEECVWTCDDETHPMSAWTNMYLNLTKPLLCRQWDKMYQNFYWLNPSHACEN